MPNLHKDVLLGRGCSHRLTGNELFRQIAISHRSLYAATHRNLRIRVARRVVAIVHAYGGKFVETNANTEIDNDRAVERAAQTLRERKLKIPAEAVHYKYHEGSILQAAALAEAKLERLTHGRYKATMKYEDYAEDPANDKLLLQKVARHAKSEHAKRKAQELRTKKACKRTQEELQEEGKELVKPTSTRPIRSRRVAARRAAEATTPATKDPVEPPPKKVPRIPKQKTTTPPTPTAWPPPTGGTQSIAGWLPPTTLPPSASGLDLLRLAAARTKSPVVPARNAAVTLKSPKTTAKYLVSLKNDETKKTDETVGVVAPKSKAAPKPNKGNDTTKTIALVKPVANPVIQSPPRLGGLKVIYNNRTTSSSFSGGCRWQISGGGFQQWPAQVSPPVEEDKIVKKPLETPAPMQSISKPPTKTTPAMASTTCKEVTPTLIDNAPKQTMVQTIPFRLPLYMKGGDDGSPTTVMM